MVAKLSGVNTVKTAKRPPSQSELFKTQNFATRFALF
jgi:hypothetical protein